MRRDTESRLRALVGRGFEFLHPRGVDGELVAVVGVRVHDDVIDVVRLVAEDDVVASRMPGDTTDVLAPERLLWQRAGTAGEVLAALLSLPDERTPGADYRPRVNGSARGAWVPTAPGRVKWLPATA